MPCTTASLTCPVNERQSLYRLDQPDNFKITDKRIVNPYPHPSLFLPDYYLASMSASPSSAADNERSSSNESPRPPSFMEHWFERQVVTQQLRADDRAQVVEGAQLPDENLESIREPQAQSLTNGSHTLNSGSSNPHTSPSPQSNDAHVPVIPSTPPNDVQPNIDSSHVAVLPLEMAETVDQSQTCRSRCCGGLWFLWMWFKSCF